MTDMVQPKYYFFILLLSALFFLSACATPRGVTGVYHRLNRGETLSQFARTYDISVDALAAANKIDDPNAVSADRVLFIPGATEVRELEAFHETPTQKSRRSRFPSSVASKHSQEKLTPAPAPPAQSSQPARKKDTQNEKPLVRDETQPGGRTETGHSGTEVKPPSRKTDKLQFIRPFDGTIASQFGRTPDGIRSNGITIESKNDRSVKASEEGKVIHSSPIKFYGNTIIIKHRKNYLTIYANLDEMKVTSGDRVTRGKTIATVEKNKETKAYSLYFEMRYNNRPQNPLRYIPK